MSGSSSQVWRLAMTLSMKYLLLIGSTMLQTCPMIVSRKPSKSSLRRGRTRSISSGRTLRNASLGFFFLGCAGATFYQLTLGGEPCQLAVWAGSRQSPQDRRDFAGMFYGHHLESGG